jgi:hypothetical protein
MSTLEEADEIKQTLAERSASVVSIGGSSGGNSGRRATLKNEFRGGDVILRNFILMAVCFTLNMGCVTTLQAVASSELGKELYANCQSTMYAVLMISSLFLAAYSVDTFGPKVSLIISNASVFISYVGFIIAINTSNSTIKVVTGMGGAAIAGLGLGIGWAGQGVYFGRAAIQYTRVSRLKLANVSTVFGSYFAAIFLGLEVILKVGSTLIRGYSSSNAFFIVYTTLAAISTIGLVFIKDIEDGSKSGTATIAEKQLLGAICEKAGKVSGLLMTNRKLQLMALTQFAFGIYVAFLNFTITSRVLILHFDPSYIGLFSALSAIPWISFARSYIDNAFGEWSKSFVMVLMTGAYIAISIPFVFMRPEDVSKAGVFSLYICAGLARSSYEFANRSIFVDFFPDDKEAAMPSILLLSAIATVAGFSAFSQIEAFTVALQALLLLSLAVAALLAYRVAYLIYLGERSSTQDPALSGVPKADHNARPSVRNSLNTDKPDSSTCSVGSSTVTSSARKPGLRWFWSKFSPVLPKKRGDRDAGPANGGQGQDPGEECEEI